MRTADRELREALGGMAPGHPELLHDLSTSLRDDGRVGALFVTGSAATGEADRYSDLDLVLVARSGEAATIASGLVELLESVAATAMARWTIRGRLLSAVLADWRRIDLAVIDAASDR